MVGLLPVRLQFLAVKWCARLRAAWDRLWTRRLEFKLCHCQLCVSRASLPRQSRVTVDDTTVQHSCFTVVVWHQSGTHSVSVTANRDQHSQRQRNRHHARPCPNLGMSFQKHMNNNLGRSGQCLHRLSKQGDAIMLLQEACRTYISSTASILPCRASMAVSRISR